MQRTDMYLVFAVGVHVAGVAGSTVEEQLQHALKAVDPDSRFNIAGSSATEASIADGEGRVTFQQYGDEILRLHVRQIVDGEEVEGSEVVLDDALNPIAETVAAQPSPGFLAEVIRRVDESFAADFGRGSLDQARSHWAQWNALKPTLACLPTHIRKLRKLVSALDEIGFSDAESPVNGGDCVETVNEHLAVLRNIAAMDLPTCKDEPHSTEWLLAIQGDIEPFIVSAHTDTDELLEAARKYRRENGDGDGLFTISLGTHGPEVDAFAGDDLDEDEDDEA